MEKLILVISITLHFFSFFILCSVKQKNFQILTIFCFLIISLLCRFYIPFDNNPDYINYLNRNFLFKGNFSDFFEPWPKLIYTLSDIIGFNHIESTENLYRVNFSLSTIFFCYLGLSSKVEYLEKMFFFSFFYYFSTYVIIRNAPLFYLLSYYLLNKQNLNLIRLGTLYSLHISSIILPFIKLISNLKIYIIIVVGILLILSIPLGIELLLNNSEKLGQEIYIYLDYIKSERKVNYNHYYLLTFNICVFFFIGFLSGFKNISKFTWATFMVYLLGFFINPVLGARLSLYLIIFLLLTTNNFMYKLKTKNTLKLFNMSLMPLLLAYTIFIFFDIHEYS